MGFFSDLRDDLSQAVNELSNQISINEKELVEEQAEAAGQVDAEQTPAAKEPAAIDQEQALNEMLEKIDAFGLPEGFMQEVSDFEQEELAGEESFFADGRMLALKMPDAEMEDWTDEVGSFDLEPLWRKIEGEGDRPTLSEEQLEELLKTQQEEPWEMEIMEEIPKEQPVESLQDEQSTELKEETFQDDQSAELEEEIPKNDQSAEPQGETLQDDQSAELEEEIPKNDQSAESQGEMLQDDQSAESQGETLQNDQSAQWQEAIQEKQPKGQQEIFREDHQVESQETFREEKSKVLQEEALQAEQLEAHREMLQEDQPTELQEIIRQEPQENLQAKFQEKQGEVQSMQQEQIIEIQNDDYKGAEEEMETSTVRSAVDETAIITEAMIITGDIVTEGSIDLIGTVNGNIEALGKLNIIGYVNGNSKASEIYAESAKINGEINSEGAVKIGASSVVIGNITASSAVIAGAVEGDIDVKGPVVLDASAIVMGNIKSKSVQINNGAVIEGMCSQCYADVSPAAFFQDYKPEKRKAKSK